MAGASSTARRTQAERSAQSDRRIMRAAVTLIARQGFSKTTLAQIGAEAGYSGGLVSYRFGSKEALLQELVRRTTDRFTQDQIRPALDGLTGVEALCGILDVFIRELVEREDRIRALNVLRGEAFGPVPQARALFVQLDRDFREAVRQAIRQGVADGGVRPDVDAAAEAAAFVSTFRGLALQWLLEPGCFDLEAVAESIKASLRAHLSPTP